MAKQKQRHSAPDEPDLKGTLYAVFGLGAFIIVSWLMVFSIFTDRF